MSESQKNLETTKNIDIESKIKEAQEILNQENVPLTKLADFVENFLSILSEKYPKMMQLAMSTTSVVSSNDNDDKDSKKNEPTIFDVVITEIGEQKLKLIKAVKEITSLGLAESKGLVDKVTSEGKAILKSSVQTKEAAEELKSKIEAAGGKAKLVALD